MMAWLFLHLCAFLVGLVLSYALACLAPPERTP
jgi:hypothetical protein